jgi:hypothetical protein
VVLVPFSIWAAGCSVHKAVQRPVADYVTDAPSSSPPVRVLAVLTKTGEKIEFGEGDLAFVIGDGVVSFEKNARLLTVRKADAAFVERDNELVSIKIKDDTYDSIRVVAETQQEVTFIVAAQPSGHEIPLTEIDQLWVQEKGSHQASEIVLAVVIVVGALFGIMAAILESQWD